MHSSRAAHSTISWASRAHQCCGEFVGRARPAARSRWRCGSSATSRRRSSDSGRRNTGRSSRISARSGTIPSRRGWSCSMGRSWIGWRSAPRAPRTRPSTFSRIRPSPSRRGIEAAAPQSAAPLHPPQHFRSQRKLNDASHTMRVAQPLRGCRYRGGHRRTDYLHANRRLRSAPEALTATRRVITGITGRVTSRTSRRYTSRVKNAQEAHEAIRPTDLSRLPGDVARFLDTDQRRLYELIWKRTIASQMESAELDA